MTVLPPPTEVVPLIRTVAAWEVEIGAVFTSTTPFS